jgi:hypothetical protein
VTERDLRIPEFRDVKTEELEFRADGKIVRKDRWERGIHSIASIIGFGRSFEIPDVEESVRKLALLREDWTPVPQQASDVEEPLQNVSLMLEDGSILVGARLEDNLDWTWRGQVIAKADCSCWREEAPHLLEPGED